jgi:hypothetical protein
MNHPEPACPETMRVYRSVAGELTRGEADAFVLHLQACAPCRRVKAEIDVAQRALPPVDQMWREAQRPKAAPRPRWPMRAAGMIAAAAALVAVFLLLPQEEGLRIKGGLDAALIVERGGKTIETSSFCEGDRLQVVLRSPRAGFVHAFWIDQEVKALEPVRVEANRELTYPFSFVLDGAAGPERLLIAVSERPAAELLALVRERPDRIELEGASLAVWPIDRSCR